MRSEIAMRAHWATTKLPGIMLASSVLGVGVCCATQPTRQDKPSVGEAPGDLVPFGTFHTENLVVDNNATISSGGVCAIGNVNSQELINGPTLQSFAVPSTAYAYGEINREEISGVVPAFPSDLFVHVIRDHATADTTAHAQHSGALAVEVDGTRTAGGNDLIVVLAIGERWQEEGARFVAELDVRGVDVAWWWPQFAEAAARGEAPPDAPEVPA